jgi:3-methyl-2-oxobutanoate hydroxymethyltransferase
MNINDFSKMKQENMPIKMITCYDYWSAKIVAETNIDCVLVGDSSAMIMHGYDSTVFADTNMIETHIKAVKKGIKDKFIIGDMVFLSYRKSLSFAMKAVEKLIKAGAHSIKLEGVIGNEELIKHIVASGVPVMGHIGFTPQSINVFGNAVVQGKEKQGAQELIKSAKILEDLGCFSIVLECIPSQLASNITDALSIPTIGIGAGSGTSGQVLVLQDLLGADPDFNPKFLKKYLNIHGLIKDAINQYCQDVDTKLFPDINHAYKAKYNASY